MQKHVLITVDAIVKPNEDMAGNATRESPDLSYTSDNNKNCNTCFIMTQLISWKTS